MTVMPDFLIALFILLSIPVAVLCIVWIAFNLSENPELEDNLRSAKFIGSFLTLLFIIQWWVSLIGN